MPNSIAAELQSHKWAMEPGKLEAFIKQVAALPETITHGNLAALQEGKAFKVTGGTATIAISGVLLKTVPQWARLFGIEATGYDEIQSHVEAALSDESIARIHLQVDSPGGMVAGAVEAADAIHNARAQKPVTATIEDLGASAAYWLTSQAQSIKAGRNTLVGSIGVYAIALDTSQAFENQGIKVIVIRSGEHKGMGLDKITDTQIAAVQEITDALASNFIEAVARGRGLSIDEITELATGRAWLAAKAQKLGLIDTVTDDRNKANQDRNKTQAKGETIMSNQKPDELTVAALTVENFADHCPDIHTKVVDQGKAAGEKAVRDRFAQLKEACGDNHALTVQCFAEGKSVTDALKLRAEQADAKSTELVAKVTKLQKEKIDPAAQEFRDQAPAPGTEQAALGEGDEASWRLEFAASTELQQEFRLGGAEAYVETKKREAVDAA